MLDTILKAGQPVCIILWVAVVYNLVFPLPGIMNTVLLYTGPILLIAHFAEFLLVKDRLKQLGHEGFPVLLKVMVYGFSWWLPVLRSAGA